MIHSILYLLYNIWSKILVTRIVVAILRDVTVIMKNVFRWFGYFEWMSDEKMAKRFMTEKWAAREVEEDLDLP